MPFKRPRAATVITVMSDFPSGDDLAYYGCTDGDASGGGLLKEFVDTLFRGLQRCLPCDKWQVQPHYAGSAIGECFKMFN